MVWGEVVRPTPLSDPTLEGVIFSMGALPSHSCKTDGSLWVRLRGLKHDVHLDGKEV